MITKYNSTDGGHQDNETKVKISIFGPKLLHRILIFYLFRLLYIPQTYVPNPEKTWVGSKCSYLSL